MTKDHIGNGLLANHQDSNLIKSVNNSNQIHQILENHLTNCFLKTDYSNDLQMNSTSANFANFNSSTLLDIHKGKPIRLQVKVLVPVHDHPNVSKNQFKLILIIY